MDREVKQCKLCGIEKQENDFHKCRRWRASYCKPCQKEFYKSWRANNAERIRRYKRVKFKSLSAEERSRRKLLARYGLTMEAYQDMLFSQGGVCKICGSRCDKKFRLSVDHCHTTQQVRGLLCDDCNNMLGRAKDNPEVLRKAAEYLDFFQTVAK